MADDASGTDTGTSAVTMEGSGTSETASGTESTGGPGCEPGDCGPCQACGEDDACVYLCGECEYCGAGDECLQAEHCGYDCCEVFFGDELCPSSQICYLSGDCPCPGGCGTPGAIPDCQAGGVFSEIPLPPELDVTPLLIALSDIDADAKADLVIAGNEGIEVVRAPAFDTVAEPVVDPPFEPAAMALADFDEDDVVDLALVDDANGGAIRFFSGDGAGGFTPGATTLIDRDAVGATAGDFDGDGDEDLVIASTNDLVLWAGDGTGAFVAAPLSQYPSDEVHAASVLDDEFEDVVVVVGGGIGWWDMSMQTPASAESFGAPLEGVVAVGDFFGDAPPDIATVSADFDRSVLGIMKGTGSGFEPAQFWEISAPRTSVALGDFDGDGHTDFVLGGETVFLTVVFAHPLAGPVCDAHREVDVPAKILSAGDVDGDGISELAISNGAQLALVRFQ